MNSLGATWARTTDKTWKKRRGNLIVTDGRPEKFLRELSRVCREIAAGQEAEKERFFELTREGSAPPHITDLAEAFGMMLVKIETREFQLEQKIEELQESYARTKSMLDGMVLSLVSTLEHRDPYTAGHGRRVTELSCAIAEYLCLDSDRREGLRIAGLLHDIGKIAVPLEILSKPGKISEHEFNLIKTHPQTGHDILASIEFPWPVAQFVLQHHRRVDGTGYPLLPDAGEIPLEAKILGVADVVEAMASHRPYRPGLGIDKALDELEKNRGTAYDPEVADACICLFRTGRFSFGP
jgi:putative nucleotidyltransferase with HDIG domain